MYAITRTALLTFGISFLILMVFLGSALHFDIFPLHQLSEVIAQFSFIGYSIPEVIGIGKIETYPELTHALKLIFGIAGLYVSIFTIGISFLPSIRFQLKALSFGLSIPLFVILFNFWTYFISSDREILRADKITLYLFTIVVYLISVSLMWYGLHIRRKLLLPDAEPEINPMRFNMIQKSIPSADELRIEAQKKLQKKEEVEEAKTDRKSEEIDINKASISDDLNEEIKDGMTAQETFRADAEEAIAPEERVDPIDEQVLPHEQLLGQHPISAELTSKIEEGTEEQEGH